MILINKMIHISSFRMFFDDFFTVFHFYFMYRRPSGRYEAAGPFHRSRGSRFSLIRWGFFSAAAVGTGRCGMKGKDHGVLLQDNLTADPFSISSFSGGHISEGSRLRHSRCLHTRILFLGVQTAAGIPASGFNSSRLLIFIGCFLHQFFMSSRAFSGVMAA